MSSDVLATFGINEAFTAGRPELGAAAMITALPLLILLVFLLMRRVHTAELQL